MNKISDKETWQEHAEHTSKEFTNSASD